ncbi:MAG: sugar phosphate isomerase/epimerase family protein [Thermomicrobiales bacterium]
MMDKTLGPGAIGVQGLSLPESIALARASGFNSVTFNLTEASRLVDEHGISHVQELFASAGVKPGYWGLPVAWTNDEKRTRDLAAFPKLAAVARELGCTRATTGIMPGSDDRPYDENFAWFLERLRPTAEVLRDEGCRLGIEFISPKTLRARYKHEFIYTMGGMMELAIAAGTGNVGVLLDAWHLYTSGGEIDDLDSIREQDVVAVHVNDAPPGISIDEQIDQVRALPMETGVMDLVGFMGKLTTMGYDGPVMPEPFSKRLDELAATDPLAAAKEAGRSMDALWKAAGLE